GGGEPREWGSRDSAAVNDEILRVPASPRTDYVLRAGWRKGFMMPVKARGKLATDAYKALKSQVLKRDRWRCQLCGRRENLEVHHKTFRSHQGSDSEENLITLCKSCHSTIHGS